MYKVGDNIVISKTNEIKMIQEIERFDEDVVLYTTDGAAYGIRNCRTVYNAYEDEINKLLEKWKI